MKIAVIGAGVSVQLFMMLSIRIDTRSVSLIKVEV